mmetsp:Transcript_40167/g.93344  ORF Transcript_40167/g.93344 Transcript_40167/m.93344 type:complete len:228 (+) Transcript_40167:2400-3083(+)
MFLSMVLQYLVKGASIGPPDATVVQSPDRRCTGAVVQQCKSTEGFPCRQRVVDAAIHTHLQRALLRDEEGCAHLALLNDEIVLPELEVLHRVQDCVEFRILEQRTDSVLLHADLDELSSLPPLFAVTFVLDKMCFARVVHLLAMLTDPLLGTLPRHNPFVFKRPGVVHGNRWDSVRITIRAEGVLLAVSRVVRALGGHHLLATAAARRAHGCSQPPTPGHGGRVSAF